MKAILLTLTIFLCLALAFATDVSGNQSGIWTLANSPYNIIGDVTIPSGSTLTIEPGVTVNAMGNYRITASGFLYALATQADSIRFFNGQADPNALWKGIRLESTTQGSHFGFCYVENAEYGINSINSPTLIHHCRFYKNQKGMQLYGIGAADPAQVIVSNNIIEQSIENGILVAQNSNALIQNNEIRYNGTGAQYRGAIQLSNQSTNGSCSPLIQGNHIHHNYKQGITAWDLVGANAIQPEILNNLIEYNLTGIYLLNASGYVADNIIRHNFIPGDANSGAGVMVAGATSQPYFERNDIYGNFTGFYLGTNAQPCLGNLSIYHAWAQGENNIHDNIDESNTLHSVYCYSYTNPAIVISAENNYWGANTALEIGAGINDHLDDPALPTVDFDPWLEPVMPTTIVGSVIYNGTQTLIDPLLQVVSAVSGAILHQTEVLVGESFTLQLPLAEEFHVVALASVDGQSLTLFGTPGGVMQPELFSPGGTFPVNVGTIEIEDAPPPHCETVGAPSDDNGLILHPVYHNFFVYAWDRANWFYDNGDWRYLRKHSCKVNGQLIEFYLPLDTVWSKIENLSPGDTWTRTEIIDDLGTQRVSTIFYTVVDSVYGDQRFPYELYTQSNAASGMIRQRLESDSETLLFHYDNGWLVFKQSLMATEQFENLTEGHHCHYAPLPLGEAPTHLGFDPLGLQLDPREVDLYWQAPGQDGIHAWTAYRVYRNGELALELPFAQMQASLTVPIQGDWEFNVVATDGSAESDASNSVFIHGLVGNDDQVAAPPVLSVYPNPASLSSGSGTLIELKGAKNLKGRLAIYNQRGQLVHSAPILASECFNHTWSLRDRHNRPCASGIYLLKLELEGEKALTRKLALLR